MANMLQRGAAWLGSQLQAHAGRYVLLMQGDQLIEQLTASVVKHEHDVIDESGFLTRVTSYDWTFKAADLCGFELRPGAIVRENLGGIVSTYEALPIGDRPCVEPKDSSGILITLHTKKIG